MAASGIFTFGQISEFQPELESIETYEQRVKMFLQANEVATEKEVPIFLSIIGASNFALLTSLLAPEQPSSKTVDELLRTLRAHFTHKWVIIAERYKFYNRSQGSSESAVQFAGELRRLVTHCNFGTFLEQALRDRFVCGLRNTAAQKRLLSAEDKTDADKLTFKSTIEITSTMEAVETDIQEMNSGRNAELVLSIQGKPCYRCGKEGYLPRVCRFRDAVCRSCGKKGHIQVVCRSKSNNQRRKAPVKNLKDADNSDKEVNSTDEIPGVFKVYIPELILLNLLHHQS